jgi:predicted nucleotidyltransferase
MARKTRKAIKIAKQFIEELRKQKIRVTRAYLYGSYVYGRPHRYSDIDVVVSPQFSRTRFTNTIRLMKLRRNVDLRISPLGYHPKEFKKDYVIPYEAMTKGIRIA